MKEKEISTKEASKERSAVDVLQDEVREAREAVIKAAASDNLLETPIQSRKTSEESVPDDRFTKRFKKRRIAVLDSMVTRFLQFRSKQNDMERQEVADKLDEIDAQWKKTCENHNEKKTNKFVLRYEAFIERVEYFLDIEKKQIDAAKQQFIRSSYELWWKRNKKETKFRIKNVLWYVQSWFTFKKVDQVRFTWYIIHIYDGKNN